MSLIKPDKGSSKNLASLSYSLGCFRLPESLARYCSKIERQDISTTEWPQTK